MLDPACGSGNFLYVTLEHLKRLEGEVLDALAQFGERQASFEIEGLTVDPHQLLGIEVNPRAAAIADLVLWIGYLQWHFRTRGDAQPSEPVLRKFHNIECRDAVLAYDRVEPVLDETGGPVTRWDGRTYKRNPVTGENVPDDTARVTLLRYVNPREAEWPEADFVVGNPPFIGTKRMRQALGDGYVDALRRTYAHADEDNADYVMYWWHKAAALVERGAVRRAGLITTNSITQTFNRRVVERHLGEGTRFVWAIPDHPWTDSDTGAAVRIAMTCVATDDGAPATLQTVVEERDPAGGSETAEIVLETRRGLGIHADLRIGAAVTAAAPLRANAGIAGMGAALHGSGFILEPGAAGALAEHGPAVIRPYIGGRDLLQRRRERYAIDFSGMTEQEARKANPAAFQHVLNYVKPERDHNQRKSIRELWWRFGWERPLLRKALVGLRRYIATTETAKHRVFQFLPGELLPDHMIVTIASDDAFVLGVLSSRIHVAWALAAGGRLGVGNDPRYNKTRCFDPFPFPESTGQAADRVRERAEALDEHRKARQAEHPELGMTDMYNVLAKLRAGGELTPKERTINEQGLVSLLARLHDELDEATFQAYGWGRDLSDDEVLEHVVALNAARAAEERRGVVRWLRPEFQNPQGTSQTAMATDDEAASASAGPRAKIPWPKSLPEQAKLVRAELARQGSAVTVEQLAGCFVRAKADRVAELLETLAMLGQVRRVHDGRFAA